ncbi:Shedu immune nuclease family protein [Sinomicrobium sp. M5D2P9]
MELIKFEDKIIFVYYFSEYFPNDWVSKSLEENGEISFKNTFYFLKSDIFDLKGNENIVNDYEYFEKEEIPTPRAFILALLEGGYYKFDRRKLQTNNTIYFFREIELFIDYFIAETKISIFRQIDNLVNEDIYIGGSAENVIPAEDFDRLIQNFPTTYEKKIYAEARISSIIKNHFETTKDAEATFQNYLNKKPSKVGKKLNKLFHEYELLKYSTILEKLEGMLESENSYSEDQWQDEILEIILLLYPKYIVSFKSVHVKIEARKRRFLDFMLVDYNGNIDVIEIKKPFENSIMTNSLYRNNHIPHKDLIGTVMQLEKYIYHLNRWGEKGEKFLTDKYLSDLPKGMEIKITNPKGFIIMGRENNLSSEQKADFEIVKRKYKNVIDVITYDDLIERLRFTIQQIKSK